MGLIWSVAREAQDTAHPDEERNEEKGKYTHP
jgi:hypothetical protein